METVHRELQAHRVKKNAIEAKVREVGEKSKERKVWVVRADIKVSIFQWYSEELKLTLLVPQIQSQHGLA